uniref:Uncharacterized protein n=1 Tax=Hucho hucho TaxID=62062 RepID=A0A4W5P963_9TELE
MAEELCTGWFRIVAGSLEIKECKSAIMMEGLKKRTRKAFGIRKKEKGDKDNDSTGSPDRDGGSQKKANGAAVNGFSGEIDWDRYNTPTVDDEGYSLRPDEEDGPGSDILYLLYTLIELDINYITLHSISLYASTPYITVC